MATGLTGSSKPQLPSIGIDMQVARHTSALDHHNTFASEGRKGGHFKRVLRTVLDVGGSVNYGAAAGIQEKKIIVIVRAAQWIGPEQGHRASGTLGDCVIGAIGVAGVEVEQPAGPWQWRSDRTTVDKVAFPNPRSAITEIARIARRREIERAIRYNVIHRLGKQPAIGIRNKVRRLAKLKRRFDKVSDVINNQVTVISVA